MPSFADSIFLFVLALLLFGPKKLPVLARELGKWMGEFRRASNEFKMQMEDELRAVEQADRQKQIAAMEAAAPIPPPLSEPEAPARHTVPASASEEPSLLVAESTPAVEEETASTWSAPALEDGVRPLPIATSGSLKMMPPATGLPTPRGSVPGSASDPLTPLVESIPAVHADGVPGHATGTETESVVHGD